MRVRQVVGVACVMSLLGQSAQAAPVVPAVDLAQAVAQVTTDSVLLSGWINDQFRKAAAFNSTAGNVVPSQLKVLGFEVGVEAVVTASKIDIDGFHRLGTTLVDTNKIDMYDRLPFPAIIGHAKIGLPFGLDAGVRVGGIPTKTQDKGTTHYEVANSIFGIDVRKKLIEEGMAKPFGLTMGLNYTHANGHISATTPYTANTTYIAPSGQTYTPTLNATGSERTDWKTDSVGAQVLLNKKILFVNPYIGASANYNTGSVDTTITNSGTVTLTDPVLGTASQAVSAGGSASGKPVMWDLRGLLGLEFTFLPFCKLGIGGEIANQNRFAGTIGLRIQFR